MKKPKYWWVVYNPKHSSPICVGRTRKEAWEIAKAYWYSIGGPHLVILCKKAGYKIAKVQIVSK
jgi:hypothetical protein